MMSRLFNQCVAVSGERKNDAGEVRKFCIAIAHACVLDGSMDEPITETGIDSNRRCLTVCVKRWEWVDNTAPQMGDVVNVDGKRYAVKKVGDIFNNEWVLDCREI